MSVTKLSICLNPCISYSLIHNDDSKSLKQEKINERVSIFNHLNKVTHSPIKHGKDVNSMIGKNFFDWINGGGLKTKHRRLLTNFKGIVLSKKNHPNSGIISKIIHAIKFIFMFKWIKRVDVTTQVEFTNRILGFVKDLQTDKDIKASFVEFTGEHTRYLDVKMLNKAGIKFNIVAPTIEYGPMPNNLDQHKSILEWRKVIPAIIEECKDLSCWLEGGSLLGAMRNGDVIPYDHSAYISFMQDNFDDVENKMKAFVQKNPDYKLEDWSKKGEKTFLRLKILATDKYVDLYFYKEDPQDNKKIQWIDPHPDTTPFKQWQPSLDKSLIFPLSKISFQGQELPAPAKTRDYLLLRYGDLRPTSCFDSSKGEYIPTTGEQFIEQQKNLIKKHLPTTTVDEVATFVGPHANLSLGYVPPAQQKKHEKWATMVHQMHDLMQKVGIEYWVDAGTLLGVYRHGAIIPWDHDADISTLQKNFDIIWRLFNISDQELVKYGISRKDYPILDKSQYQLEDWSKSVEVNGQDVSLKNYLRLKNIKLNDYLDIYTYQLEPDSHTIAWNEPFPKDMAYLKWHRSIPKETMFPLKKAKFCGKEVMVPNKSQEYMEMRYGDIAPSKIWDDQAQKYVNAADHEYNTGAHSAV